MRRKAIFLIGSPKTLTSTSDSICNYLSYLLMQRDFETEKLHIYTLFNTEEGRHKLLSSVENADIIIFSSPLYIDCIPYVVTKFLEVLAGHLKALKSRRKQIMMAISNCGFPEASQNNVALRIYKNFAREVGFEWIGCLSFCMGAALNGVSMKGLSSFYPSIRKAFKLTAEAIKRGVVIPPEATTLAGQPFVPTWIYIWAGNNIVWQLEGLKFGVLNLNKAPYEISRDKNDRIKNA